MCEQFRKKLKAHLQKHYFFKKIKTYFSHFTRAVGFDRAGGAIESNCPSGSKSSRIFQNFHANSDGTVHTLDGTEYNDLDLFA